MSALVIHALVPLAVKDWLQPAATGVAALVAIIGVIITVAVQRKSSRETIEQARRSADASAASAEVAKEAVGVNRETAAGVAQRAHADSLAKRYQEAASQLGHDKSAVRLAGAYAMALLADDWEAQRQQCIDVLCAYLRMPSHQDTELGQASETQVRKAIFDLIGAHLDAGKPVNWCDCRFDFSQAEIDSLNWRDVTFNQTPFFNRIEVNSFFSITNGTFLDGAVFYFAQFSGRTMIQGTTISGGTGLQFAEATFADCIFTSKHIAADSLVNFSKAKAYHQLHVTCVPSEAEQGLIGLTGVTIIAGGKIEIVAVDDDDSWAPSRHCVHSASHGEITLGATATAHMPRTFTESVDENGHTIWKNA